MCELRSKIIAGNVACLGGSGGAIVASSPIAAQASQAQGAIILGMGWNELGILIGALVGIAGLIFGQYWAIQRNKREQELHKAQLASLRGDCDV